MRPPLVPHRWSALLLLVPLLGCSGGARRSQRQVAPQSQPAPQQQTAAASSLPSSRDFSRDMVAAHNQARAQARPTPKPALPPLTWSSEAAQKAASWARKCRFEHNPNRGEFGENLAAATPGAWTTPEVVKSWADEGADYDLARNTCKKGKACGHYTQVVWRNTSAVGCATVMCSRNSPFGKDFPTWQLWVCNYAPPGNYLGQRPY